MSGTHRKWETRHLSVKTQVLSSLWGFDVMSTANGPIFQGLLFIDTCQCLLGTPGDC